MRSSPIISPCSKRTFPGSPYVKSRHSKALMARIGRTHRSVEFKHQNISAVLDELGMPWIPGYKPKRNYQNAIFDAIDRYLTDHPAILEPAQIRRHRRLCPPKSLSLRLLLQPPASRFPSDCGGLSRNLIRSNGTIATALLARRGRHLSLILRGAGSPNVDRADLARKVRWIAAEDGDGAGYDVLSFNLEGRERLIEVKTTNGAARTPFFLTRNECGLATERPADWRIYRVHLFAKGPRIFTITPPLENAVKLIPETWRASF